MTSSMMTRMPRLCASADETPEIPHGSVNGIDRAVVGDVVAVVAHRRGIERQQPDRRHPEAGDVIQPVDETGEIAHAVAVGIEERLDVKLVDDRVPIPVGTGAVDLVLAVAGRASYAAGWQTRHPLARCSLHLVTRNQGGQSGLDKESQPSDHES